ncbi:MAG: helix-turn-helix transcriptional regulator [Lentisphaeria bacterium]|nr:helix-turn-helix transcriptional regulator [Lentisphaeria bacterium]
MGYFDDFQLLNVINVRMYGNAEPATIFTRCHYIGLIRGTLLLNDQPESRPLIYLTPKHIHTYSGWRSPAGKYRDNFYLECTGKRADRLFAAFDATARSRLIFVRDHAPFLDKLNELQQLFAAGEILHRPRIILCIEEFAALLEENLQAEKNPAARSCHLDELLFAINKEPEKKRDFAACAKAAGFTLRHWNRIFTAATGMPPHRFVNFCRIKKARNLLCSTNLSIKEIASQCGFDNASDFSRFFRKNTAITPGECRRSALR